MCFQGQDALAQGREATCDGRGFIDPEERAQGLNQVFHGEPPVQPELPARIFEMDPDEDHLPVVPLLVEYESGRDSTAQIPEQQPSTVRKRGFQSSGFDYENKAGSDGEELASKMRNPDFVSVHNRGFEP